MSRPRIRGFLTKTPKSQFEGGGRADEGKIAPESV
jgi:hypothetical protein